MSDYTDTVERILEGCEAFSVGACPGCLDCGLAHIEAWDEDPEACEIAGEPGFSWSWCDSCGSTFGGNRYPAHYRDEDGEVRHLSVCEDCYVYHGTGEELEDWRPSPGG